MKRNPDISDLVLLGALGAGALYAAHKVRSQAEPATTKIAPRKSAPAAPTPALSPSARYTFAIDGEETLCWDNQNREWVNVELCESAHVLEGYEATGATEQDRILAEFQRKTAEQNKKAESSMSNTFTALGVGFAAANADMYIVDKRKKRGGRFMAVFGVGFVATELALRAIKGEL